MISYNKKIHHFNTSHNWFDYQPKLSDLLKLYVVNHLKKEKRIYGVKEITHTIEIDLLLDEETLFKNLHKNYRQEYRRAETDGFAAEETTDYEAFAVFFYVFAKKRGTYETSVTGLKEKKENLVMYFSKFEGNILAAHSYLIDREEKIVRHYQTAVKRFDNDLNSNIAGRANKFLLISNLFKFKKEGFNIFDMGGYEVNTMDKGIKGINEYKIKFGGVVVPCNDYYSYPYWMLKKVSSVLGLTKTV
jgi:hypothetical protein